jgi:hypothetical protein
MTEMPKSNTFVVTTRPSGPTQMKMFCGFRSRWITPCAWAAATPRMAGSSTAVASPTVRNPLKAM